MIFYSYLNQLDYQQDQKEKSAKVTAKHAPTGPVFGTVIHETMERIYKEDLQLEEAIKYYDNSLSLHQEEIIDTMSVEELKEYGHRLLTNLLIIIFLIV